MSDMKFGELDGVPYVAMDTMQMAKEWLKAKSENNSLRAKLQIATESLEYYAKEDLICRNPTRVIFDKAKEALEKIK